MRTPRILKTQSSIYDAAFSTEPYVTLAYSELEAYENLVKYVLWRILFRTMRNPSIFKTLPYSESESYS